MTTKQKEDLKDKVKQLLQWCEKQKEENQMEIITMTENTSELYVRRVHENFIWGLTISKIKQVVSE